MDNNKFSVVLAQAMRAKRALKNIVLASPEVKNLALKQAANQIDEQSDVILAANAKDMQAARDKGLSTAKLDRLELNKGRLKAISDSLRTIADQDDPVGEILEVRERPNGLTIHKVAVPIGVIGVIYEARPNVTTDAAALCLKAGNGVVLRCGSEVIHSSIALMNAFKDGLASAEVDTDICQMIEDADRACVSAMLAAEEAIDAIVPRGGRGLIARVMAEAKMPVFAHLDGICHVYVHKDADPDMALSVCYNSKMRRVGICGSAETFLIDRSIADKILPPLIKMLADADCEIRGDQAVCAYDQRIIEAVEADWSQEYLDKIISIKLVDNIDQAIEHTNHYGSHHTDSIITQNDEARTAFLNQVDSAIVMHNSSTQFADGGEFGMGAEIGISTGRMHARGPVGAHQLVTHKYQIYGTGQTRP